MAFIVTPMKGRMPDLLKEHNRFDREKMTRCREDYTTACKTDNRNIYDTLDQISKDTELCLYVKQHKFKQMAEVH